MNRAITIRQDHIFRIGIINAFVLIGLLRLTNMNFYLSQLLGFDTEINNLGGNAFNFNNYIGAGFLGFVLFMKLRTVKTRWFSAWPLIAIMLIYLFNYFLTSYANPTWLIYQEIFLGIALLMHIYVQKLSPEFSDRFQRGMKYFFLAAMVLVMFCALMIVTQNSMPYYMAEFNEVFVQTLDDFGVMKQRYGYLMGFLISYILFMQKGGLKKLIFLSLILFTAFGIRSLVIGLFGAGLLFTVKNKKQAALTIGLLTLIVAAFFQPMVENLVYDTRFYSFVNAYDIIHKFPFGVGLGGYPIYTEEYHRQLFASFRDVSALLDHIPLAPESDIVHLFGSLGLVFGGIHFALQARILWFTYKLKSLMTKFDKCILFYFCFMTFFGISEDSMFTINYWIFFGLASGIVAKLLRQKEIAADA